MRHISSRTSYVVAACSTLIIALLVGAPRFTDVRHDRTTTSRSAALRTTRGGAFREGAAAACIHDDIDADAGIASVVASEPLSSTRSTHAPPGLAVLVKPTVVQPAATPADPRPSSSLFVLWRPALHSFGRAPPLV